MTTDLLTAASAVAQRLRPPLTLIGSTATGSFDDALVEFQDGQVVWRVIRERSVLGLLAAPEFDRTVWYDTDLLKRLFREGGGASGRPHRESAQSVGGLTTDTVQDLFGDLEQLRADVARAFSQSTWKATREQLNDLGRRRDAELFGRPG